MCACHFINTELSSVQLCECKHFIISWIYSLSSSSSSLLSSINISFHRIFIDIYYYIVSFVMNQKETRRTSFNRPWMQGRKIEKNRECRCEHILFTYDLPHKYCISFTHGKKYTTWHWLYAKFVVFIKFSYCVGHKFGAFVL